ncbi:hypothetical protein [Nostoc sp.]
MQVQILSGVPKYLGVAQMGAQEFWELQVAGTLREAARASTIPATQTLPL